METIYKDKARKVGYFVETICDHPKCEKTIDRGRGYACGGEHGDLGGIACTGYFCGEHRIYAIPDMGEDITADLHEVPTTKVCEECYKRYLKERKAEIAFRESWKACKAKEDFNKGLAKLDMRTPKKPKKKGK